jgi:D-citramalate synthase
MDVGAKVQNLTKGSKWIIWNISSKKTPEQHFTEIAQTIALCKENNIATNVYLEDGVTDAQLNLNMFFSFRF